MQSMTLVYVGDGISSESPFATQYYNNDPTGDLQFRLVFAVYGDQFYKFIMQPCILVTAAVFLLVLCCCCGPLLARSGATHCLHLVEWPHPPAVFVACSSFGSL